MKTADRSNTGLASRRVRWLGALCALLVPGSLLLPGCGGSKVTDPQVRAVRPLDAPTSKKPRTAAASAPTIDETPLEGLEVRWWVASDENGIIGSTLALLGDPDSPLSAGVAQAWNENGLRLVRVPRSKLLELHTRLPTVVPLDRTWFGWLTSWTPVFQGRRFAAPTGIVLDSQPVTLPPGTPRILARSWPTSSVSGPVLRIELALQLQTTTADDVLVAAGINGAGPRTVMEEGRIFPHLSVDAALELGWAYVVVPERPGVKWTIESKAAAIPAPGSGDAQAGPKVAPPQTLGEAMMASAPDQSGRTPRKVLLVLLPDSGHDKKK